MTIAETVLNFFITNAHADTGAAAAQGPNNMSMLLLLGFFIAFMYFAIWRPQSKRAKEHRALLSAITKGDEVLTAGGMVGRVAKVADNFVVIAVAENVEIAVQKSSISGALPKGTLKSLE